MSIDIEQLKMILDAVKGVSNDASTVAIWYFVLPVIGKLLSDILGFVLFGYVFYQLGNTVTAIFTERKFWKIIGTRLKVETTDWDGSLKSRAIPKIQDAILELISNGKWEEK